MKEIWKDIPNCNDKYKASNLGRIKSLKLNRELILSQNINIRGYYKVNIYVNNKRKTRIVHQLIAEAFLNHIPKKGITIDHINNIKTDNRLENLQILTQRQNTIKSTPKGSSKYLGVSWSKKRKKWTTQLNINKKRTYLGAFDTELEAHDVYQNKLKELNYEK